MSEEFLIKFTELSADFEEHAQASKKEEEDNMPEICNNLLNFPTQKGSAIFFPSPYQIATNVDKRNHVAVRNLS